MSAVMQEEPRRGVGSRTNAGLEIWANWYIIRTSHEFGWPSHWAVLNYHGLSNSGHKILFDTPESVRAVDVAVGQLPDLLRRALVLKYWWHREIITGENITDWQRSQALPADNVSQYREIVRTAKLCLENALEIVDYRRRNASIG